MIRRLIPAALPILLSLFAGTASAQQTAANPNPPRGGVDDTMFAAAAADGGESEITLTELGLEKATDPDLKKFSRRILEERGQINKAIRSLFAARNINLPTQIDSRARFCIQSLSGLSGAEFDRSYAKAQYLAHTEIVSIFEAEADRGEDPEIKAFAAKALPTLKEHLRLIQPIASKGEKVQSEQDQPPEK